MDVFTIQISKRRLAAQYKVELVDTTVKTGLRIFAPTWAMVMGHKAYSSGVEDPRNPMVSDEEYTQRYRQMMVASWRDHRPEWEAFLRRTEPLALGCYCEAGKFCHRHQLRGILEELCGKLDIPFRYYGELE